jgi:hypothetical protein
MESLQAIQKAVNQGFIDAIPYESQFDDEEHFLYRYKADMEPAIGARLPFYITGPLQEAIRKWAGDTYGLLDHVYFETEPMIRINPGDLLDFTNAQEAKRTEQIPMKKLSKQKLAEGKQLIAKMSRLLKERTKIDTGHPIYDETYFDALDYLDGERLDFPIKGKAKIEDSVSELD